jgi:hypothetical protein
LYAGAGPVILCTWAALPLPFRHQGLRYANHAETLANG